MQLVVRVAQWIERLPPEQEVAGANAESTLVQARPRLRPLRSRCTESLG